ncbi:MAG: M20 family peptidase [Bacteroidetes bacterium]|nr:M20 family peptidase [Bacteroidota bacterium]MCH8523168.1 M20 family peptidase [Balneolales bacterium]
MIITSLEYSFYLLLITVLGVGLVVLTRTIMFTQKARVPRDVSFPDLDVDAAVQRLSNVVQFKTISTQNQIGFNAEEFLKEHAYLEEAFPLVHKHLKKEVVNSYSLLYTWQGNDDQLKPVMFTSHLDVVPVEPGTEGDWEYPPFSGKITDSHVYGRGTMDVQCGVMGILEAVEWLLQKGYRPARTIYLGFGHDEEVDGIEGAMKIGALLQERGIELDYLLDEGLPIAHNLLSDKQEPVALVAVSEKGYLSLELSVESEGGHSSVPQGKTAIAILGGAIHKLESNPLSGNISGIMRSTFETMAPRLPLAYRSAIANLWLFRKLFQNRLSAEPATNAAMRTTTATTIFDSGIKENLIPTQAKAVVNFRVHPNDTIESVIEHVRRTVNDPNVKIRKLEGYIEPSPVSDTNCKYYKMLRVSIRQVFNDVSVSPSLMVAATDARHYTHLTKNIYRFLPLRSDASDLDRVHGTNERIAIENYADMIRFYIQMMRNTAVVKEEKTESSIFG